MGPLRKFEALLFSERPLDEPVPLFPADERLNGGGQAGDWTLVAPLNVLPNPSCVFSAQEKSIG